MSVSSNLAVTTEAWSVRSPSREYKGLPLEVRDKLDQFLVQTPVRLGDIARALGVRVLLSTLPRGISGQICQEDGRFVIRINRHESKPRQRFTLAHELSHFLLHRDKIEADGGWSENVLLRSGQPATIEFEANRLASDLIIPSDQLARATEAYDGPMNSEVIEDLARRFGVSISAMEIKLQMS